MINENEFEVLVCLEREHKCCSQREVSKLTNLSLGTVNKVMISLTKKNFVSNDGNITTENAKKLKNFGASIFVAGTSSIFRNSINDYKDNIKKLRNAIE